MDVFSSLLTCAVKGGSALERVVRFSKMCQGERYTLRPPRHRSRSGYGSAPAMQQQDAHPILRGDRHIFALRVD
jgi:hypothetical protein